MGRSRKPCQATVGVWDDGAEPSACLEVPATATIEDLQYIASLIGVKFRQKHVLIFSPQRTGRDFMQSFAAHAPVQLLAEEMYSAGIGNRTYVLERDGGLEVFVYDDRFDPDLQGKLASVTGPMATTYTQRKETVDSSQVSTNRATTQDGSSSRSYERSNGGILTADIPRSAANASPPATRERNPRFIAEYREYVRARAVPEGLEIPEA
jgi:hypothetical protein